MDKRIVAIISFGLALACGCSQTMAPVKTPNHSGLQIFQWNPTVVASYAMTAGGCRDKIAAVCVNQTYEGCEGIIPLSVWDECATEWEKRADLEGWNNPTIPYIAMEFLMGAALRHSGIKQFGYVGRVANIARKYQKLFGADALKRLEELTKQ